jgi:protocatechuate 3,4-dioxygenase alpha subunit
MATRSGGTAGVRATGGQPRTPSQTIGPFFGFALPWPDGPYLAAADTPGWMRVSGRLTDGRGDPVPDALIEIWQADAAGHFDHPEDKERSSFRCFGRCPTDEDGRFYFVTVKPGRVPDPEGQLQAPHIDVSIFARGLLKRLVTRVYFEDEVDANAADSVLALVTDPDARSTLIATRSEDGFRFDIRMQGDGETVFFDF